MPPSSKWNGGSIAAAWGYDSLRPPPLLIPAWALLGAFLLVREARAQNPERPDPAEALAPAGGSALYRDIAPAQSELAHRALGAYYAADLPAAAPALRAMRALEEARDLPPLSYLMEIAIAVMILQNDDAESPAKADSLARAVEGLSEKAVALCKKKLKKDAAHPTYLLILGGIKGFSATLGIQSDPSQALTDGFQALKQLERALEIDKSLEDCHLGTGMFHCTAANAPLFVRATVKLFGRTVNMRTGLEALRRSAYYGQYTSVQSQLFLIQFLSPYEDELRREKRQIFRTLERTFPRNPFYTFLRLDEALCFYPDSFFRAGRNRRLQTRMGGFSERDFASKRYAELVKHQYALLDPEAPPAFLPDTAFALREFAFYPHFLRSIRLARQVKALAALEEADASLPAKRDSLRLAMERTREVLRKSALSPQRKRYYGWRLRDAWLNFQK